MSVNSIDSADDKSKTGQSSTENRQQEKRDLNVSKMADKTSPSRSHSGYQPCYHGPPRNMDDLSNLIFAMKEDLHALQKKDRRRSWYTSGRRSASYSRSRSRKQGHFRSPSRSRSRSRFHRSRNRHRQSYSRSSRGPSHRSSYTCSRSHSRHRSRRRSPSPRCSRSHLPSKDKGHVSHYQGTNKGSVILKMTPILRCRGQPV